MNKIRSFFKGLSAKRKYIYLFIFIFLGVAVFYGMSTGGQLMRDTAAGYLDKFDLEDISLVSSHGIGDMEVKVLQDELDIANMEESYQMDVGVENLNHLINIESMPEDIVKYDLREGRFPEKSGEIAIDADLKDFPYQIGDTIRLKLKSDNPMMRLKRKDFTIVGRISSPEYILKTEKGVSDFTGAKLDGYGLISREDFDMTSPNFARIYLKDTKGLSSFSNKYKAAVDNAAFKLSGLFSDLPDEKLELVKKEAKTRIKSSEEEIASLKDQRASGSEAIKKEKEDLDKRTKTYEKDKKEFDETLEMALDLQENGQEKKEKVDKKLNNLKKNEKEIQSKYDDQAQIVETAQAEFAPVEAEYNDLSSNIEARQADIDNQYIYANNRLAEISTEEASLRSELAALRTQSLVFLDPAVQARINEINYTLAALEDESSWLEASIYDLEAQQEELNADSARLADLEGQYNTLKASYDEEKASLDDYQSSLDELKEDIEKKSEEKKTLDENIKKSKDFLAQKDQKDRAIKDEKAKLDEAKVSYDDHKKAHDQFMVDSEENIKELKDVIERSKEEEKGNIMPSYTIKASSQNQGMELYSSTSYRVDMLTKAFPILMLIFTSIVAFFLSKSLADDLGRGYYKESFDLSLYRKMGVSYALALVLGIAAGFFVFSYGIFSLYKGSFIFDQPRLSIFPKELMISLGVMALVFVLAVIASRKDLKVKAGVDIESKTLNNLFSRPLRLVASLLCLAFVASLGFLGLSMSRSIRSIPSFQFDDIIKYDVILDMSTELDGKEKGDFEYFLTDVKRVREIRNMEALEAKTIKDGYSSVDFQLRAIENIKDFDNLVNFRGKNNTKLDLVEDGVLISRKMAELNDLKKGDKLGFTLDNSQSYEATITGVFDNYSQDFAYMSGKTYKKLTDRDPVYRNKLLVLKDSSSYAVNSFVEEVKDYDQITAINTSLDAERDLNKIISPLNYIAGTYIVVSIILAFLTLRLMINDLADIRLKEIGLEDRSTLKSLQKDQVLQIILAIALGLAAASRLFILMTEDTVPDSIVLARDLAWPDFVAVAGVMLILAAFLFVNKINKYPEEEVKED